MPERMRSAHALLSSLRSDGGRLSIMRWLRAKPGDGVSRSSKRSAASQGRALLRRRCFVHRYNTAEGVSCRVSSGTNQGRRAARGARRLRASDRRNVAVGASTTPTSSTSISRLQSLIRTAPMAVNWFPTVNSGHGRHRTRRARPKGRIGPHAQASKGADY